MFNECSSLTFRHEITLDMLLKSIDIDFDKLYSYICKNKVLSDI